MKLAASYFGNRIPRYVRRDMEALKARGFDRVIHTFSENDLAYYPDTMREIVAISHDCGLEVMLDPWGVARIFGGEAYSGWLLEEPDLWQRGASGRPLGGACLNHPGLRPRLHAWTDAVAATGARWVFWDEPHWVPPGPCNPSGEICTCPHCLDKLGRAAATASAEDVARMRGAAIRDLLADLTAYAASRGLASSVCLLPQGVMDQPAVSWEEIAAGAHVDELGTDPYWQAFGLTGPEARDRFIDAQAQAALRACRRAGIACMLWLQAFRIPAAGEEDLLAGARRLLAHEPDTVAVWSFEASAHMSALACERPGVLWDVLTRELRGGRADGT